MFLWWCYVSQILHNSHSFSQVCAHLKRQFISSRLYGLTLTKFYLWQRWRHAGICCLPDFSVETPSIGVWGDSRFGEPWYFGSSSHWDPQHWQLFVDSCLIFFLIFLGRWRLGSSNQPSWYHSPPLFNHPFCSDTFIAKTKYMVSPNFKGDKEFQSHCVFKRKNVRICLDKS